MLFSGGLDSFIAWEYLNRPKTLYFDIGHRYSANEVEVVRKLVPNTIIDSRLDLRDWEEPDANIPMRNAFFIMMAAHYNKRITLVVQKGEMEIPDRSPRFFKDMGKWLTFLFGTELDNTPYLVESPFFHMTKTKMVQWYVRNQHDMEPLLQTRSCYMPGDLPCGACSACFRRWVAMTNCGVTEEHATPILLYDKIPEYIDKMNAGKYDTQRTNETFKALGKAGWDYTYVKD